MTLGSEEEEVQPTRGERLWVEGRSVPTSDRISEDAKVCTVKLEQGQVGQGAQWGCNLSQPHAIAARRVTWARRLVTYDKKKAGQVLRSCLKICLKGKGQQGTTKEET